ncbi:MAG: carnitine 3-dehydrogenase [Gammaproteobacteria bacterium]|jgi:carnitine 3-dehydrogenase
MTRPSPENVQRVACVGSGTIGAGWAALFLANGLDVNATDPGNDAESITRTRIARIWPKLEQLGLANGASQDRLSFTTDLAQCVSDAQFIQESAPDNEELKIDLLASVDASCPADTIIASSSSKFIPSRLGMKCTHPERITVGHPFVPSYLVPLVEIVGGANVDPAVPVWLDGFYRRIGKSPITLKNEIEGYVANRLQFALLQEASKLVEQGVCDWIDVEHAVTKGPGFRWPIQGPVLHRHLGGGAGGVRHMIAHFGWRGSPQTKQPFIDTVDKHWGDTPIEELEDWRDENMLMLLKGLKPAP